MGLRAMNFFVCFLFVVPNGKAYFFKNLPSFVIYGDKDNRINISRSETLPHIYRQSSAVALLVNKSEIFRLQQQDGYKLKTLSLTQRYNACPEERFANQPTAGFCTAFLVAKNLAVTAGHCLREHSSCKNIVFVFDWYQGSNSNEKADRLIFSQQLFFCREIVFKSLHEESGVDLAFLRLDRFADDREILVLDKASEYSRASSFYTLGHPLGLPQKYSDQGSLLENLDPIYFATDLDAYSVGSGSPVFDQATGMVAGVLIRGQEDFVEKDGCLISEVCNSSICLGEEVLRGSVVNQVLEDLTSTKENFWKKKKSSKDSGFFKEL